MKKWDKVSVIIPTLNEESNIVKCLQSIKKQDYLGKIEIILVDNHSKDKTTTKARHLVSKLIIAGKERSMQRNIGAQKASGRWLLFIDADMQLHPRVISECVNVVNQNEKASMIAILQYYRGFNFWGKALALEQNCYGDNINLLTAARFFNKHQFLKIKGFNPNLLAGEDWDLTQRLIKSGIKIHHLKKYVIYHNESSASLLELLKKESYYIKFISRYAKDNPKEFLKQSSISYRLIIWAKSWKKLIFHPILTVAFLWYKFLVWLMWQIDKKFHLFRAL